MRVEQQSFQQVSKMAYSHGLESIYALEHVDLKSVRPLSQAISEPVKKECNAAVFDEADLKLPLPPKFSERLDSHLLLEPLRVLAVSAHVERVLRELGIVTIGQLLQSDFLQLAFVRGLGQGHVDELKQKLHHYTAGKQLYQADKIDFAALLRSLLGNVDARKAYLLLQPFQLQKLIHLTPAENAELKRLPLDVQCEFSNEAKLQLKQQFKTLASLFDAFVLPWLERRQGIGQAGEIEERLQNVAADSTVALLALAFLKETLLDLRYPFAPFLVPLEGDYYAAGEALAARYHTVLASALSYLYHAEVSYSFDELCRLLYQELAPGWQGIDLPFIQKTLRSTQKLLIVKLGSSLVVRRNFLVG